MSISRRQAMQSMALSVSALSGCASLSNQDPIFDAHCHIIDHRFPVIVNQGYIPPHFPLDQYLQETKPLGVTSGAIVSGSFQGFDQTYLKAALKALGPQWVGVTQIPNSITDQEILELTQMGVKALRFNVFRGRIDVKVSERSSLKMSRRPNGKEVALFHPIYSFYPDFKVTP